MKKVLYLVLIVICLFLFACGSPKVASNGSSNVEFAEKENSNEIDFAEIERICDEVCGKSEEDGFPVEAIIAKLGSEGYIAVDEKNKINMTCAEQLTDFIKKQEACESAAVRVVQVTYDQRLFLYELSTQEGKVFVRKHFYRFGNHHLEDGGSAEFEASDFLCTEEGYLIIAGSWVSPEMYSISLGEEDEHIAFRITPLDEKCRELCEKYIMPVSYELNNMFLTNWTTSDYGELDFYDLFAKFYKDAYSTECPYKLEDICKRKEYSVPAEEFEGAVMKHMSVSGPELRERLRFDEDSCSYLYRPRGLYELDYCDVPYPEVVSYTENEDGSVTLLVNAVFPQDNTSKLFSHRTTVKEMDGEIYYLSNQITGDQKVSLWWHGQRLSDDVWKKYATEEE